MRARYTVGVWVVSPPLHTAGWQWTWPKASSAGGSERMQIYLGAVADLQMNLYSAPLSLSLALPGSMPHMGPCRNFSFWNIGNGFNLQISAFSLCLILFLNVSKIKTGKSRSPYFDKLLTSFHNNAQNVLSNKTEGYQPYGLVCSKLFDNQWNHQSVFLLKKRDRIYSGRWSDFSCTFSSFGVKELRRYLKSDSDRYICWHLFIFKKWNDSFLYFF